MTTVKLQPAGICHNNLPVWSVGMENKRTGEKVNLEVTSETNEGATCKCLSLFGYDGDYKWTGTGPSYEK